MEGIEELRDKGATIIYTTHYMEEVEILCDRIIILDKGVILASGTSDELKELANIDEKITVEGIKVSKKILEELNNNKNVDEVHLQKNTLKVTYKKGKNNLVELMDLLKKYNLYEFKDKYPSEISGGMRQRVALIRTLAVKPKILLLDEAFSALDYQTRIMVTNDIYEILRKEHITALIVTHDISEAISMSDRVLVLSKRPGTIKDMHKIEFDIKRKNSFKL